MEPITFSPLHKERVWGGRKLESVFARELPHPQRPFGESWEIVDRGEDQSLVDSGPLAGQSLHHLWNARRDGIFGSGYADLPAEFPILIKILDAREDLSVQVHPPAGLADSLNGEPKTEMWFIADREPGAKLYVGLKHGVTPAGFRDAIATGTVADCIHTLEPAPGESIFIPSGRLHAIGGGFLIFEIQQNSDTTYRVFDWNRQGLDGQPRELHVAESLASIDFNDFEPTMDRPAGSLLASCKYFETSRLELTAGQKTGGGGDRFSIIAIVSGDLQSAGGSRYGAGRVLLVPKGSEPLTALTDSLVLEITLPRSP